MIPLIFIFITYHQFAKKKETLLFKANFIYMYIYMNETFLFLNFFKDRVLILHRNCPTENVFALNSSLMGFPCGSAGKEFACNVRDLTLIDR